MDDLSEVERAVSESCSVLEGAGGVTPAPTKTWVAADGPAQCAAACESVLARTDSSGGYAVVLRIAVVAQAPLLQACTATMKQLLGQVQESEEVNTNLMQETTKLQQEVEHFRSDFRKVKDELEIAKAQVCELRESSQDLRNLIKEKDAAALEASSLLENAQLSSKNMASTLEHKDLKLQAVLTELSCLTTKNTELERTLQEVEQDMLKVEKVSGKHERAAAVLVGREEMSRNQLFETRQELMKVRGEREHLHGKLQGVEQRVEVLEAEVNALEAEAAARQSPATSVSYRSQQTQTYEPSKQDSLQLTRVLLSVETMAENMGEVSTKLRTVNRKLEEAQQRQQEHPVHGLHAIPDEQEPRQDRSYADHDRFSRRTRETSPVSASASRYRNTDRTTGVVVRSSGRGVVKPVHERDEDDLGNHIDSGVGLDSEHQVKTAEMQTQLALHRRVLGAKHFGSSTQQAVDEHQYGQPAGKSTLSEERSGHRYQRHQAQANAKATQHSAATYRASPPGRKHMPPPELAKSPLSPYTVKDPHRSPYQYKPGHF